MQASPKVPNKTLPELEVQSTRGIGLLKFNRHFIQERLPGWEIERFMDWALQQRNDPECAPVESEQKVRADLLKVGAPAYQIKALIDGCITMPCLKTGKLLESRHGVPYRGSVGYRFASVDETYILLAGGYSRGFSLTAVWLVKSKLLICLPASSGNVGKRALAALGGFSGAIKKSADDYIKYVRAGNHNSPAVHVHTPLFPHHIWNELPGLEVVASAKDHLSDIPLVVVAEPVAPIKKLFPEIAARVVQVREHRALNYQQSTSVFPVRIGSRTIPESLVDRISRYSVSNMSQDTRDVVQRLAESAVPVLCVTIRVQNRRWISEEVGLLSLLTALRKNGLTFSIVVLGFSIQHGESVESLESARNIVKIEAERARRITEGHPKNLVHHVIGAPLIDSFAIAQHCDYYVANHGTIQHRLGWFGKAAGLVHANRVTIESGKGSFATASARECGPPVKYIDASAVRDVWQKTVASERRGNLCDYDFDWRIMLEDVEKGLAVRSVKKGG